MNVVTWSVRFECDLYVDGVTAWCCKCSASWQADCIRSSCHPFVNHSIRSFKKRWTSPRLFPGDVLWLCAQNKCVVFLSWHELVACELFVYILHYQCTSFILWSSPEICGPQSLHIAGAVSSQATAVLIFCNFSVFPLFAVIFIHFIFFVLFCSTITGNSWK